jgi:hypothetical protein
MNESNFLPMSQAMERSDAVLSHRELRYLLSRRSASCREAADEGRNHHRQNLLSAAWHGGGASSRSAAVSASQQRIADMRR